jgi:hypothetical protein
VRGCCRVNSSKRLVWTTRQVARHDFSREVTIVAGRWFSSSDEAHRTSALWRVSMANTFPVLTWTMSDAEFAGGMPTEDELMASMPGYVPEYCWVSSSRNSAHRDLMRELIATSFPVSNF